MMNSTSHDASRIADAIIGAGTTPPPPAPGEAASASLANRVLLLAATVGGAVRNTVYVVVDALRGRYDY